MVGLDVTTLMPNDEHDFIVVTEVYQTRVDDNDRVFRSNSTGVYTIIPRDV